jgi:hypothetical protein
MIICIKDDTLYCHFLVRTSFTNSILSLKKISSISDAMSYSSEVKALSLGEGLSEGLLCAWHSCGGG